MKTKYVIRSEEGSYFTGSCLYLSQHLCYAKSFYSMSKAEDVCQALTTRENPFVYGFNRLKVMTRARAGDLDAVNIVMSS